MMITGHTCKLCMTYIQDVEPAVLDDNILKRLMFLHIDLDHSDEENNFLCSQCDENIENIFDFKLCVVTNTERNMIKKVDGTCESAICHLCKNYEDQQCMISLTKFLNNNEFMAVFQGHLQEVELQIVDNSMVCEVCQKSVAIFWSLVESSLKGRNWSGDIDSISAFTDDNIRTKNCKQKKHNLTCIDSSSDSSIKVEIDDLLDYSESVYFSTGSVKKEENEDADMEDMQSKAEEVEIKDDDELLEDHHMNNQTEFEDKDAEKTLCSYQTDVKSYLKQHVKVQKLHSLKHKSVDDVQMFKCIECSYETRFKENLENHLLIHKIVDEVQIYKCNECAFETRFNCYLKSHLLKHKSVDEVQLYKCEECAFKTKYKGYLKSHLLKHKNVDEVQMYKCIECSYETRFKAHLKSHLLKHKSVDEIQMHKCKECPFETRFKSYLKSHFLKHKSVDEVQMYKCNECFYETMVKFHLKRHLLIHKKVDKVLIYKCKECSFETRLKGSLANHLLKHKSLDRIQMYKCSECSYKTRFKTHLKRHLLKHESVDEIQMH